MGDANESNLPYSDEGFSVKNSTVEHPLNIKDHARAHASLRTCGLAAFLLYSMLATE